MDRAGGARPRSIGPVLARNGSLRCSSDQRSDCAPPRTIGLRSSRDARPALSGRCAALGLALVAAPFGLGACQDHKRQDENETAGTYPVSVTATFPRTQKLARRSKLEINVRNTGPKTIPNIAVTVKGFGVKDKQEGLADPRRPVFAINGAPKELAGFPESKDAAPEGGETNYVDTWALGPLKPGRSRSFRWSVTAVRAGGYHLRYIVSAGLDGKAKAEDDAGGGRPSGSFSGKISDNAPDTRVADDGETVVEGTR